MNNKLSKGRPPAFDPDLIVTKLRSAILRDLSACTQMYKHADPRYTDYTVQSYEKSLVKKYTNGSSSEQLREEAFSAFLDRCCNLRRSNTFLRRLRNDPSLDPNLHRDLERARLLIGSVLGAFDCGELARSVRHSAGASIGVPYHEVSLSRKFKGPCSGTASAIELFKVYARWDNSLSEFIKEELKSPTYFKVIRDSRATTVPKTAETDRLIACEGTINMFFQLGIMTMLYRRLAKVGLDVRTLPQRHKRLAQYGSIHCNTATIDFSNASDTVSFELVKWLMPQTWLDPLCATRCASMKVGDLSVKLPMYATMGNATTFPVETLVFWALGVVSQMSNHGPYDGSWLTNPRRLLSDESERAVVSVFGDDVILPSSSATYYINMCQKVGFSVNSDKSFWRQEGFRESCGGDYLHGRNVRPLYLRAPTSNRKSALGPWLCTILNELRSKYIQYFGELLWLYDREALDYIFSLAREHKLLIPLVPPSYPSDAGLQTEDLQRLQACYEIPISTTYSVLGASKRNAKSYTRHDYVGGTFFRFYRFQYRYNIESNDNVVYWDILRKMDPYGSIDKEGDNGVREKYASFFRFLVEGSVRASYSPDKRVGGYTVASATNSFWDMSS